MGAYASSSRSKGLGNQMPLAHILESILLVFFGLQCIEQDNNLSGPLKANPKSYDLSSVLDKFTPRIEKGSPNGLLLNLSCHHMETSNSEASAHHKHPSGVGHGCLFLALDEPWQEEQASTANQRCTKFMQQMRQIYPGVLSSWWIYAAGPYGTGGEISVSTCTAS